MKFELPASAKIHADRAAAPRRRGAAGFSGRKLLFGLAAAALLLGVGSLGFGFFAKPRLDRIEPAVGEPGGVIRLEGRGFGTERGESRVELDGVAPTASSYLAWSDRAISVRMPAAVDSGLVHVVTRGGRSNAKLFMNRARLPTRPEGDRTGKSGPYIASASAEAGPIGSLLVLTGQEFGASREDGEVLFSMSPESGPNPQVEQPGLATVSPSGADFGYESWTDKEIRVRVPDGAVSGAVSVVSSKGRSNGFFFRVTDSPGAKRFKDRRSYSIVDSVSVTKVRASGPNELYLWAPLPVESASQRLLRVLARDPPPMAPDIKGAALYRFKDLATGVDATMSQSYLVAVYAVETDVDPERVLAKPAEPPSLMAFYSAPDERVASAAPDIQAVARRIVGSETNPWRIARLVWEWMHRNIVWKEGKEVARLPDVLTERSADSYSYALLACALLRASGLPSLPVAGYLVDPNRKAVRHYWVELYLYGLGWVPLDLILGGGASPGGVAVAWDDRTRYFGNLDNRHLAFSRGSLALVPVSAESRKAAKERRWSFQNFYEEAVGGLDAYSSFWGDVEVTGLY